MWLFSYIFLATFLQRSPSLTQHSRSHFSALLQRKENSVHATFTQRLLQRLRVSKAALCKRIPFRTGSNQADAECNICSRYCINHVKFTSYCELIECSQPIKFFIMSLMYSNRSCLQYLRFGDCPDLLGHKKSPL